MPRLVGDTWPISAKAAQSLVGEMPGTEDYEMTGTLIEVRKAEAGTALTAVIEYCRPVRTIRPASARSRRRFASFSTLPAAVLPSSGSGITPKSVDSPVGKGGRRRDEGIVDARGFISRVLMAWTATNVLPEEEGRLKQTTTYELVLERRLSSPSNVADGGQNAPLLVPEPLPDANEANSWLLYQDPSERYYLLHPQNLAVNLGMSDPNILHLVDQDHGQGKDAFILTSLLDRKIRKPTENSVTSENFSSDICAHWAKLKLETLPGPAGWLPQADWAPLRVFRKELAVKTSNAQAGARMVLSESTSTTISSFPRAMNASMLRAGP